MKPAVVVLSVITVVLSGPIFSNTFLLEVGSMPPFSEQRLIALATAVLTKRCSPSCDFLNLDVAPYNVFELFAFIKIAQS